MLPFTPDNRQSQLIFIEIDKKISFSAAAGSQSMNHRSSRTPVGVCSPDGTTHFGVSSVRRRRSELLRAVWPAAPMIRQLSLVAEGTLCARRQQLGAGRYVCSAELTAYPCPFFPRGDDLVSLARGACTFETEHCTESSEEEEGIHTVILIQGRKGVD
jgi:hypothetical protein